MLDLTRLRLCQKVFICDKTCKGSYSHSTLIIVRFFSLKHCDRWKAFDAHSVTDSEMVWTHDMRNLEVRDKFGDVTQIKEDIIDQWTLLTDLGIEKDQPSLTMTHSSFIRTNDKFFEKLNIHFDQIIDLK